MKKHEILSPQSRAMLFDAPPDPISIVRYYTFSTDDLALIRRRRRDANRLGFAVHLAYLRFPGRSLSPTEKPPADMVRFIGEQLGIRPDTFAEYAQREETRREQSWPGLFGQESTLDKWILCRLSSHSVDFSASCREGVARPE